jgi:hypothetical protein
MTTTPKAELDKIVQKLTEYAEKQQNYFSACQHASTFLHGLTQIDRSKKPVLNKFHRDNEERYEHTNPPKDFFHKLCDELYAWFDEQPKLCKIIEPTCAFFDAWLIVTTQLDVISELLKDARTSEAEALQAHHKILRECMAFEFHDSFCQFCKSLAAEFDSKD